jgi:hypothetical protein
MPKCRILGCKEHTEAVSGLCLQHACVMWLREHPKGGNEFHK